MQKNRRAFSRIIALLLLGSLIIVACGCTSLRPQVSLPADEQGPIYRPPTLNAQYSATATTNPNDSQFPGCKNDLTYLDDLTIPDGTYIAPNSSIDKQWSVKNSGTCNWNETYTLRLFSGPELGTNGPQSITPLRADAEGIIRINFTAPTEAGNYSATWQAYDPNGQPFGEILTIEINVIAE
jgi:hypothetical protein